MSPEQTAPAPVLQAAPGLLPPGASAAVVEHITPLAPPPSSAAPDAAPEAPDTLPDELQDPDLAPAVTDPDPEPDPEPEPETAPTAPTAPVGPQNGTPPNKALQRLQRQEKATAACLSGLDQHQASIENLEATQKLLGRNILILAGGLAVCLYLLNKAKLPDAADAAAAVAETAVDAL